MKRKLIYATIDEKKRIAGLTRERKSQQEITQILCRSRSHVHRIQKQFGVQWVRPGKRLRDLTAKEEEAALTLLRKQIPSHIVAVRLGLPHHRVRLLLESHPEIKRAERKPKAIPPNQLARILRRIETREDHALAIATTEGVGYERVLGLAHQIHGTPQFVGGRTKIPFRSNFPQKLPKHLEAQCQS